MDLERLAVYFGLLAGLRRCCPPRVFWRNIEHNAALDAEAVGLARVPRHLFGAPVVPGDA